MPHNHTPDEKRGKFGTERLGHFYTEIREITKRGRQKVIEEMVAGETLTLAHMPSKENPNAVKVSTSQGEQIGYLMRGVGNSFVNRIPKGYRYAAIVDEILEWEPFEGHTHYGVSALVFRVAPRVSDDEIQDYVHENFHGEGFAAERLYLKAFGLTPKCNQPEIAPTAPVAIPANKEQLTPPPSTNSTVKKSGCAWFVVCLVLIVVTYLI